MDSFVHQSFKGGKSSKEKSLYIEKTEAKEMKKENIRYLLMKLRI